jgi:hypothetical protein
MQNDEEDVYGNADHDRALCDCGACDNWRIAERTFADDYAEDESADEADDADYFEREQERDSNETLGLTQGPY